MIPFSFSLSLPLSLKYDELHEGNAEAFLSSFCSATVSRLLVQHNNELLAWNASLPLDENLQSWRFLLPRQKTIDSDGLCTIEVDFDLFLFKGEKLDGLKQHLTEICYRVCKQTLLFSRNSGCALSSVCMYYLTVVSSTRTGRITSSLSTRRSQPCVSSITIRMPFRSTSNSSSPLSFPSSFTSTVSSLRGRAAPNPTLFPNKHALILFGSEMQSVNTEVVLDLVDDGEDEPRVHDQEHHETHDEQHLLIHKVQIRIERQNQHVVKAHEAPVHASAAEVVHVHVRGEEGIRQAAEDLK